MNRILSRVGAPAPFVGGPAGWALSCARWASAAVFISFGVGKFVNHASETSSFRGYGLPWPGLFTGAIGVLELLGGVLLALGLLTGPAALALAGDMIAAIILSGILHGETVSLTLAPAMLIVMLALLLFGPGRLSLQPRLAARRARRGAAGATRPLRAGLHE